MKKILIICLVICATITLYSAWPKRYCDGAFSGDIDNKNTEIKELISPYEEAF